MEWIKTEEGYVRSDCISGVYIDRYAPEIINLILNSDHVVVFKKYDFEAKKNQWITWDYLQQVVDECVEDDKVELDVNEFKKDEFEFGFLQRGSAFNYVFHKKGTSEYIVINCNI